MYFLTDPLYFVTGNPGKVRELAPFFPQLRQLDVYVPEIQSMDSQEIIRAKLKAALPHVEEGIVMVEDTSLSFEGLGGLPGPFIKFFLKNLQNEGLASLVEKLETTSALARSVIGIGKMGEEPLFFEGEVQGRIVYPRGEKDFGWGPIFEVEGSGKTFGEMELEEKMVKGQRGAAVRKLVEFLHSQKAI